MSTSRSQDRLLAHLLEYLQTFFVICVVVSGHLAMGAAPSAPTGSSRFHLDCVEKV